MQVDNKDLFDNRPPYTQVLCFSYTVIASSVTLTVTSFHCFNAYGTRMTSHKYTPYVYIIYTACCVNLPVLLNNTSRPLSMWYMYCMFFFLFMVLAKSRTSWAWHNTTTTLDKCEQVPWTWQPTIDKCNSHVIIMNFIARGFPIFNMNGNLTHWMEEECQHRQKVVK